MPKKSRTQSTRNQQFNTDVTRLPMQLSKVAVPRRLFAAILDPIAASASNFLAMRSAVALSVVPEQRDRRFPLWSNHCTYHLPVRLALPPRLKTLAICLPFDLCDSLRFLAMLAF